MILRVVALCRIAAMLLAFLAGSAWAQDISDETFAAWEDLSVRVQRVLDADTADNSTLERLRGEVAGYRDNFLEAQHTNDDQVQRIQRQLAALGPSPTEGEQETPEIAGRRATLDEQLQKLREPVLRSSEAFVQADGLVSELDRVLRDRQARQVLKRYPIPLNPLNWTSVLGEISEGFGRIPEEVILNVRDEKTRSQILQNLPRAILLLLAGTFLVFRSRHWLLRGQMTISDVRNKVMQSLLRFLISLCQLVLPWVGLGLLLASLKLTGVFGEAGTALLLSLIALGFLLTAGTWLVGKLFPRSDPPETPLRLLPTQTAEGRILTLVMVVMASLNQGWNVFSQNLTFAPQTEAYASFVLSLVTAAALFGMGLLFRRAIAQDVSKEHGFSNGIVSFLGSCGVFLAVVAPLAGLAGYVVLTKQLVFPAAGTFLVFGLISFLYSDFKSASNVIQAQARGTDPNDVEEGLAPVLVGAIMILAAIPILALIWGARVTDLTEIWSKIQEGFQIGDVRLSPSEIFTFVLAFWIGYALTRLIQGALRNTVLPKTRLDQGARTALVSGVGYIGIFLAAIISVTMAGIDLSNLAILASALAVGIGFGLQTIVSNFVSGIILLVERPVSEGDWIEVGGQMGYVRRISVRATRIETFDRTDVIVPNADLVSGQVTNWTRGNLIGRVIVSVGVAYGTDTRKVEKILLEIAYEHPMVVISPPPTVLLTGFGADSVDFEIRAILRDINFMMAVKSDMNHEIVRRFAEEDIQIPFAQRDIWLRNPEALSQVPSPRVAPTIPPEESRGADMQVTGDDPN